MVVPFVKVVRLDDDNDDNTERVVFFQSFSNSKLDLPLFRGLFFFILHQNEARVGGISLHHKSIAS